MVTMTSTAYIAPKAKEISTLVAAVLCGSVSGSTSNEEYTEDIYEW